MAGSEVAVYQGASGWFASFRAVFFMMRVALGRTEIEKTRKQEVKS